MVPSERGRHRAAWQPSAHGRLAVPTFPSARLRWSGATADAGRCAARIATVGKNGLPSAGGAIAAGRVAAVGGAARAATGRRRRRRGTHAARTRARGRCRRGAVRRCAGGEGLAELAGRPRLRARQPHEGPPALADAVGYRRPARARARGASSGMRFRAIASARWRSRSGRYPATRSSRDAGSGTASPTPTTASSSSAQIPHRRGSHAAGIPVRSRGFGARTQGGTASPISPPRTGSMPICTRARDTSPTATRRTSPFHGPAGAIWRRGFGPARDRISAVDRTTQSCQPQRPCAQSAVGSGP